MIDDEFIAYGECSNCAFDDEMDFTIVEFELAEGDCPRCGETIQKILEPLTY